MVESSQLLSITYRLLDIIQAPDFTWRSMEQMDHIYVDLVDTILQHNILYYQQQSPIISDHQRDILFTGLKSIETRFPELIAADSPTQYLVGQIQEQFVKASHMYPLLSLDNSYDLHDVHNRYESISKMIDKSDQMIGQEKDFGKISFLCQPKYDGISIELVYHDGVFVQAITRGDGTIGEDVTANVAVIPTVIKKLQAPYPPIVNIRGEIVMPISVFEDLNRDKIAQGQHNFVNPRNACSGSIKQLDPNITAQRGLICYVYDILNSCDLQIQTQQDISDQLCRWGCTLYPWSQCCDNIKSLTQTLSDSKIKHMLDHADIDFDGIVVKINELKRCQILGNTNHHPRRAIAYKFPAKQIHTALLGVEYQVGRMGTITPVALLDPVSLSGVTISKASLHNFEFISQKDIRIGDQLVIQRSGEVIPYVVSVVSGTRNGTEQMIIVPTQCPVCQTPTFHLEILVLCPNEKCPAKIKQQILHFVSRNAMNIEGLGDSIVDMMVQSGILTGRVDIYKLTESHLRPTLKSLPLIGDKKLDQIITQIHKSKHNELYRIIHAIGIPQVGKKTSMMIAQALAQYISDHNIPQIDVARIVHIMLREHFLTSIFGLGVKSVQAIQDYLSNAHHITNLMQIQNAGVKFDVLPPLSSQSQHYIHVLGGKHIAISGIFGCKREELRDILVSYGAIYDDIISRKTDILLLGGRGGSKLSKAQQRGITILSGINALLLVYPDLESQLGIYREKPEVGLFGP